MAKTKISLMDLFLSIKWASSGTIYDMSKTNYNWGWGYLGDDTPTVQDFNFVQQKNDEKDKWLFGQINEVLKDRGITASDDEVTSLRDAIKGMIEPFKNDLKAPDGFKFIGQCESIEQLRTIEPTEDQQRILVKSYYAGKNLGGGVFYADFNDAQTSDNAGTVIVTTGGKRWKKAKSEPNVYDFGWLPESSDYPNSEHIKQSATESLMPMPAYSFNSRNSLVIDNNAGKLDWLPDGTVVVTDGCFYIKEKGKKEIADLPNWATIPELETIGNHKSGYRNNKKTNTTIKYTQWNGVNINVIEIKNPKLNTLKKLYAPNVADDGTALRVTPKEFSKNTGYKVVINCDGFRAPNGADWTTSDYGKAVGLQISEGKLYQDWLPFENRDEAIVMLKTGELVAARKDDGITGQQWIERGALWSAAFVGFVVENGRIVPHSSTEKSARTVLGQKSDGTIIIFCVEGQTGRFGLTIQQCGEYALSLGCQIAICLDGGGSTQCWWKDSYASHSSDSGFKQERKCGSFLVIDDNVDDYDTGWQNLALADGMSPNNLVGARWRQYGKTVRVEFDVKYNFEEKLHTPITKDMLPEARKAYHASIMKTAGIGDTGKIGGIYAGAVFAARVMENTPYIVGAMEWTAVDTEVKG